MRLHISALVLAGTIALVGGAHAEQPRLGLAAPLSGPLDTLGRQMRDGAIVATRAAGLELIAADDGCSAEGGATAARDLVARDVDIVVGFLCSEAIEAALPILTDAGIPAITSGARADSLTDTRDRNGWLVWRMAPRADAEAAAVADILVRLWREELFAIVDDGTVYGRDLSESLRFAAETARLQPVFVDTYRPQSENQIGLAGRLGRAGASHVFVGGDRDDIAIIARDAAELDQNLTIAGGEALRAAGTVPLAPGTLMIGLPEWADVASAEVLARFSEMEVLAEGYALPTHAAVEIALQAVGQTRAGRATIADILSDETFDTAIGPISFDEKGDLARNPFRLLRYDGERFLPAD